MIALHETCLEYFRRRLAEGWRCISLEGHNAVLLSPEGIRRELDLRNDVETLRPNAAGDETNWSPLGGGDNYEEVDEAVADDDTSFNRSSIVFEGTGDFYISIKENGITTDSGLKEGTLNYVDYYEQWNTRPSDSGPWTRDDIVALQIGYIDEEEVGQVPPPSGRDLFNLPAPGAYAVINSVKVYVRAKRVTALGRVALRVTQVYVEVDYPSPVVATNAATGITPASAILNGTLDEDMGEVWEVRFQWGKTEDYGNNSPWQAGFGTGDTFTLLITLEPGTLYHFRAQAKNSLGTLSGVDVAFWTLKPSVGKAYAFSREFHIKRTIDVLDKASIAASGITTLADCKGLNLIEVPSSLTLTVEATYDALATQGIKVHVKTSLTDRATGAHTGADGAAALTDAEAHFVVNELIGLTIKNLTDGSSGAITANTGTGVTATLVGGTDNDWDGDDAYIIEGAGYDTEDWDSFTPAFGAGSSIRQTEHYDVDPVYLKVLVKNLDGVKAVTDVKIIMAVGT